VKSCGQVRGAIADLVGDGEQDRIRDIARVHREDALGFVGETANAITFAPTGAGYSQRVPGPATPRRVRNSRVLDDPAARDPSCPSRNASVKRTLCRP